MKSILKIVKQLETTYEVLEYIENVISKIKDSEFTKNILDIDNDFVSWQKIEIIANKIAIKKAKSPEEFEACATYIEKNDYGDFIFDEYYKNYAVNVRNRFQNDKMHIVVKNY